MPIRVPCPPVHDHAAQPAGWALRSTAFLLVVLCGLGLALLAAPATPAAARVQATSTPRPTASVRPGIVVDTATLGSLLQGPITVRVMSNTAVLTLTTAALQRAIVTDTVGVLTPTARLDATKFNALLVPLVAAVKTAPRDARIDLVGGKPVVIADVPGHELNTQNALPAAVAATRTLTRSILLPTRPVTATLTLTMVRPLYPQWAAMFANGFTYRYNGQTWRIPVSTFAGAMRVTPTGTAAGGYQLSGIRSVLDDELWSIADAIDVQAADSRFRLVDGQVTQTALAHGGQQLDHGASLAAAVAAKQYQSDLVVTLQPAPAAIAAPPSVSTPDLLAKSATTYIGSSPERAHNVEFGTSLIDGALVAPGAEFDTAGTMGALTIAAGFQMGFGIVSDGTTVTTVPAEAGGICQVVTTLFHTVFWMGLPVTERHNHSYWIAAYGRGPDGLQGLDATVSPPEKNFRWRNTTGNWILVKAHAANGIVNFELWGTNPHWRVAVTKPVITNVVPTSQTPIYENSDLIPYGTTRQVEHAQAGFSSTIRRQVFDAQGSLLDDWQATGTYLPSHDRFLVGQKDRPLHSTRSRHSQP